MTRILILFLFAGVAAVAQVATFSIVAYDAVNGDWGVTVASRYFRLARWSPGRKRAWARWPRRPT